MEKTDDGYEIVRTEEDLKEARGLWVYVICPKCGTGWTSLQANAKLTLKYGCPACADEENQWAPRVRVMKKRSKEEK